YKHISLRLLHLSSREDFQQKQNQQYQIGLVKAASGVVYHRKYYHWQLQKQ
ncbi:hypothetical protein PROFUN_16530, partial [Planoprotostelium fungivorum]